MKMQVPVAIVVGAGPSGLAASACLNHLSIPNIVLEREDCLASLWRKYSYDRLHLHLPKQYCELPHMAFPVNYPKYVSRKDFVQFLDEYASRFEVRPLYRRSVESAAYDGDSEKWNVKARNANSGEIEEYRCRFLVVATGETSDPFVPALEGLDSFAGEIIHSTGYKNGEGFSNKNVLVVGSGNSGMEIALDLANSGAKTSIVVRSPLHMVSRGMMDMSSFLMKYLPFNIVEKLMVILSKLRFGNLSKYGIRTPQEGPFSCKIKYGKYPIIDVGTYDKIKSGEIQVLPAIIGITGNDVLFDNGHSHPFDVIVLATGFKRSTTKWLKGDDSLLNEDGFAKPNFPNYWKGKNGLYCVGLARRGLYGASLDAQNIAQDIKTLVAE